MASAPPRRNLPPQAETWGRWVEDQIRNASNEAVQAKSSASNAQGGVAAAVQSAGEQITNIQEVVIPTAFVDLEGQIVASSTALEGQIASASTTLDTKINDTKTELENDIQVAVQGAGGNWNYYSSTTPTPQPGGFKVGDLWFDTSDGNRIRRWNGTAWVATAFGGAALANGAVGDDQLTGFSATKITTGFLAAARLAAASISADKVLIGVGTNLVPDPTFLNAAGWSVPGYVTTAGGRLNGGSLLVPASTTQLGAYMGPAPEFAIPVQEGQSLRVGAYYNSAIAVAAANRIAVFVRFLSPSGTWSSPTTVVQNAGTATASSWNRLSGNVTVPANVTHMAIGLFKQAAHNGSVRFSDPSVQLRSTGELIVDGAIDGQTITGAVVQTVATANRGVKLNSAGLQAFNASGVQTVDINASTGEATLTGGLRTSLTGTRLQINPITTDYQGSISVHNASGIIVGEIGLDSEGYTSINASKIRLKSAGDFSFLGVGTNKALFNNVSSVEFGNNVRWSASSTDPNSGATFERRNVFTGVFENRWTENVTIATGWYVTSGYPAPVVVREALTYNKVTLTGTNLRRSSAASVGGAQSVWVMTIPQNFRPPTTQTIMGAHAIAGNFYAGHWIIGADGNVQFIAFGTGVIPADSAGGFAANGTASWYM